MTNAQIVFTALVAIMSTARLTRLLTWDSYPPAEWVRNQWDKLTKEGEWSLLVHCGYCASPWIGAANLAWGYFTGWQEAWYLVNIPLALAYAAAIVMAHDGDD